MSTPISASRMMASTIAPAAPVPVRLMGGASDVTIRRPKGTPVRVQVKGWAASMTVDDQHFDAVGRDVRLQSPGFDGTTQRYDMEIAGGANHVVVTED